MYNTLNKLLFVSVLIGGCTSQPTIIKPELQVINVKPPANLMVYPLEPQLFRGRTLNELLDNIKENSYLWATQREQLRLLIDYVEKSNQK